jgi:hypothetical protein
MRGAITPLPQYAFMAWCSVKAQRHIYLYVCFLTSWVTSSLSRTLLHGVRTRNVTIESLPYTPARHFCTYTFYLLQLQQTIHTIHVFSSVNLYFSSCSDAMWTHWHVISEELSKMRKSTKNLCQDSRWPQRDSIRMEVYTVTVTPTWSIRCYINYKYFYFEW